MENIQKKKFREIDSFHFTSFLAWIFLNFVANCEKFVKFFFREIDK